MDSLLNMNMNMNNNMNSWIEYELNMIVIIYQDEHDEPMWSPEKNHLWDEEKNAEAGDNRAMPPGLEGPRKSKSRNFFRKFCVFLFLHMVYCEMHLSIRHWGIILSGQSGV